MKSIVTIRILHLLKCQEKNFIWIKCMMPTIPLIDWYRQQAAKK